MPEQRRLPNGRFAKFKDLGGARVRTKTSNNVGVVRISTTASSARKDFAELRRRVPADLLADAQTRAQQIQERIRAAMLIEYPKGTGRAARGVFAKVRKERQGTDKEGAVIRVTSLNYREMNFLTNLAGRGYFKSFPVAPYRIFAKGAEEKIVRVNSATGESYITKTNLKAGVGSSEVGRLKVPRPGRFFTTEAGRGGVEKRVVSDALGGMDPGDRASAFFFYPLWVNHPGFKRDVISLIVLKEGANFISDTVEVVRRGHIEIAGNEISTDKGTYKLSTAVVRDEIPIHSITLSRGTLRSSAGDRARNSSLG